MISKDEAESNDKPIVITVDDDEEINAILRVWLKNVFCKIVSFSDPKEFLLQLKTLTPRLCIVDINIGAPGVGFKIVEAIRSVLGTKPPIILFSSEDDAKEIAHGMDLGADDYLIKPSSKSTLVEKTEFYLNAFQQEQASLRKNIPDEYRRIRISTGISIEEIDEFGIKTRGDTLLSKGTSILLKSDFLSNISENEKPVAGTVISNWIYPEDRSFGAFIEFFQDDEVFLTKVRTWVSSQNLEMNTLRKNENSGKKKEIK